MSGSTGSTPIRTTVSSLASFLLTNQQNLTALTSTQLETLLNTYATLNQNSPMPLGSIQPDYEANVAENQALLASSPAWTTLLTSGTGKNILEIQSTAQAFNQFSIERAAHETMLGSAKLPNSVYALVSTLGLRIQRKIPASVSVTLNSLTVAGSDLPTYYYVPAYTQFSINGVNFFNRQPVNIPINPTSGSTVPITLYQGTVSNINILSNGQPFQVFDVGNSDFAISNFDLIVQSGAVNYQSTNYLYQNPSQPQLTAIGGLFSVGFWTFSATDNVYKEETSPSGNLRISFGNGSYGSIPPASTYINVTYVTTLGSLGNTANSNLAVTASGSFIYGGNTYNVAITGSTGSSPVSGGSDQQPPSFYNVLSPGSFSAKLQPSTGLDFNSFALNFPYGNIIDAYFLGQQQFAPNTPAQAMNVQAVILPQNPTPWTTSSGGQQTLSQLFQTWIAPFACQNLVTNVEMAVPVNFEIFATVYCKNNVNTNTIESLLVGALQALCALRPGIIGYSFYESDIMSVLINTTTAVAYVDSFSITNTSTSTSGLTDLTTSALSYQYPNLTGVTLTMQTSSR